MAGAVGDAEQSVTYADRSGDAFQRMAIRAPHADALHQTGLSRRSQAKEDRLAEAATRFREAERQPDYPLLYSQQGFRYCDLLLTTPEGVAWQICLGSAGVAPTASKTQTSSSPGGQWDEANRRDAGLSTRDACAPLLDIALDQLTLGRAALYTAMLIERPPLIFSANSLRTASL